MVRCNAKTLKGKICKNMSTKGHTLCAAHISSAKKYKIPQKNVVMSLFSIPTMYELAHNPDYLDGRRACEENLINITKFLKQTHLSDTAFKQLQAKYIDLLNDYQKIYNFLQEGTSIDDWAKEHRLLIKLQDRQRLLQKEADDTHTTMSSLHVRVNDLMHLNYTNMYAHKQSLARSEHSLRQSILGAKAQSEYIADLKIQSQASLENQLVCSGDNTKCMSDLEDMRLKFMNIKTQLLDGTMEVKGLKSQIQDMRQSNSVRIYEINQDHASKNTEQNAEKDALKRENLRLAEMLSTAENTNKQLKDLNVRFDAEHVLVEQGLVNLSAAENEHFVIVNELQEAEKVLQKRYHELVKAKELNDAQVIDLQSEVASRATTVVELTRSESVSRASVKMCHERSDIQLRDSQQKLTQQQESISIMRAQVAHEQQIRFSMESKVKEAEASLITLNASVQSMQVEIDTLSKNNTVLTESTPGVILQIFQVLQKHNDDCTLKASRIQTIFNNSHLKGDISHHLMDSVNAICISSQNQFKQLENLRKQYNQQEHVLINAEQTVTSLKRDIISLKQFHASSNDDKTA
jgi:hypothetical protein